MKGNLRKSCDIHPSSAIDGAIKEWIHDERDRRILARRLLDGVTFERLAEEFDMSVRQIKRIVYAGQYVIFRKLQ